MQSLATIELNLFSHSVESQSCQCLRLSFLLPCRPWGRYSWPQAAILRLIHPSLLIANISMRPYCAHLLALTSSVHMWPFLACLRRLSTPRTSRSAAALFRFVSCPFRLYRFFFWGEGMMNSEHLGIEVDRLESEKFKNRDFYVESKSVNKSVNRSEWIIDFVVIERTQLIQ
jgi:hypothetical protein